MKRVAIMFSVTALVGVLTLPGIATAQNPFSAAEQRRHDDKANQGFSTRRDTTGTDRDGGYIRYSMGYRSGSSRSARSSEEAERQYRRGEEAYAAGEYSDACLAFRHAKNLYARVGETQMSEASASLAKDACTTARASRSG